MFEYIAEVRQGKIKGKYNEDCHGKSYYSFCGIPYAKPPQGKLRFKAPVPAGKWPGIRDGSKEGSSSVFRNNSMDIVGSEDCLYLNVYTPQHPENMTERKPVLVYVHGGMFLNGSPSKEYYGPDYLIAEDIVVVTVTYRLGILGFLSLDDPDLGVPGNAALKDILMALQWIHNNIEAFGGNAQNVTLAGHSAGSALVHCLVLSSLTIDLFHRAIIMSGNALCHWSFAKSISEKLRKQFDVKNEKDLLSILQKLNIMEIIELQEKFSKFPRPAENIYFAPVIEKVSAQPAVITQHPLDIIKCGNYNQVPLLMGYTSHEGIIAPFLYNPVFDTNYDFELDVPSYLKIRRHSTSAKIAAKKLKEHYFTDPEFSCDKENRVSYVKMMSDILIVSPFFTLCKILLRHTKCPVYAYKFSLDSSLNISKKELQVKEAGVCHGDELGYIFKNRVTSPANDREREYIAKVVELFSNFVKYGNPNSLKISSKMLNWRPIKYGTFNILHFDHEFKTGINLDMEKMFFWEELHEMTSCDMSAYF